jgi:2-keto-3-deoxy-galactonokinase
MQVKLANYQTLQTEAAVQDQRMQHHLSHSFILSNTAHQVTAYNNPDFLTIITTRITHLNQLIYSTFCFAFRSLSLMRSFSWTQLPSFSKVVLIGLKTAITAISHHYH